MISPVQAQTPYYYLNRSFTPVDCYIGGTPTIADLYAESEDLTETVLGAPVVINSNETYAIEKQTAITICYDSSIDAWNAVVNYNGTPSNYPGKIFDNVGWVRGTRKTTSTTWGAYLWVIQNRIAFQSSTSEWWVLANNLPVVITNVMVGSLGDYGPVSNVVDVGPSIPTNYPGANQSDSGTYHVDITNVCYQLSIPDIWIMPRYAVTNVGGSNVQYTVTGTNIPQGVTWKIIPEGVSATIQTNADWHSAEVTPGNVATNYKVRATSVDNTNFYDQVDLMVVGLQSPLQYKIGTNTWADIPDPLYVCKDTTVNFKVIKIPTNASWPSGKPVWGGVVNGSGVETNSYTFSTISTSTTDYKLVTAECGNTVTGKVLVGSIQKIPLGGSTNLSSITIGKVYVPTKWGGSNTLSGAHVQLFYTDGSDLDATTAVKIFKGEFDDNRVAQGNPCKYDVPGNNFGWYYVKITNDAPTSISSAFHQTACSSNRPWNFYWWSKKGDYIREPVSGGNGIANTQKAAGSDDEQVVALSNAVAAGGDIIRCGADGVLQSTNAPDDEKCTMINLFDAGGALEKYDAVYSETAKACETANDQSSERSDGHCLGASMASILVNQPSPTAASTLTIDELEGLWAELGEKADIYDFYDGFETYCPAGPPSAGTDGTDAYVGKLHSMLEQYIKGEAAALQSNLRAYGGGNSSQVWNHAIWKYDAEYEEAPGGNEKIVKITNNLSANDDHEPPTNYEDNRDFIYVYIIEYKNDGTVNEDAESKDWISVGGSASFALQTLIRVTGATWGGNNPHVTESNVRSVDESN